MVIKNITVRYKTMAQGYYASTIFQILSAKGVDFQLVPEMNDELEVCLQNYCRRLQPLAGPPMPMSPHYVRNISCPFLMHIS